MTIDWKGVFELGHKLALSVWFNGSCLCQSLTGVGVTVTCKEMLFVWLHVSWTDSYTGFWNLPGFFILIYDQICISDMCSILVCYETTMMTMKCDLHETYHCWHTAKWANINVRVYKCTSSLTDNNVQISPLFPNQCDDNAIQNKWCRGNESLINRTKNTQQENPRRPYDHTVQKRKSPIWNDVHANFLAWDWNDNCNGITVIQGKEIVYWLAS